ncbi:MAG: GtrA family protein, partial [Acidaminococcaceae bacterium]|nr:GtrA family protein [Acidaminococcaceae bacterium]
MPEKPEGLLPVFPEIKSDNGVFMEKDRLYEIIRFALVGGASFVVDYALLYICTERLGIHYLYSAAISFTVSVI